MKSRWSSRALSLVLLAVALCATLACSTYLSLTTMRLQTGGVDVFNVRSHVTQVAWLGGSVVLAVVAVLSALRRRPVAGVCAGVLAVGNALLLPLTPMPAWGDQSFAYVIDATRGVDSFTVAAGGSAAVALGCLVLAVVVWRETGGTAQSPSASP